jgi:hypothetical protein
MTFLQRLDSIVHVTRLDALTAYGHPQPRSLRWLPLTALIGLPVGYVLTIISSRNFADGFSRDTFGMVVAAQRRVHSKLKTMELVGEIMTHMLKGDRAARR